MNKMNPASHSGPHKVLFSFAFALFIWMSPAFGAFVHPGIYHNEADLAFMRQKIEEKAEPWYSAWKQLQSESYSRLTWTPHPAAEWDAGKTPYMDGDALAAYSHALQWALTGNPEHANKAIEILNAWSAKLQGLYGETSQEMLVWGWNGCYLANAAEILRSYVPPGGQPSGWKEEDIERFQKMLTLGYNVIRDFKSWFNGNWDAAMMNTMLCTAVFMNDQEMFDKAIGHFYGKYDNPYNRKNGNLENYVLPTGQCQESGRDQGHVQMGLGNYAAMCEVAWKQGVDLYGAYDNRLMKGFEYTAKYMLGSNDVPFEQLPPQSWTKISEAQRGRYYPIYEAVYQHYVYRKGLKMPFTEQVVLNNSVTLLSRSSAGAYRPEAAGLNTGISWGTLTMFKGSTANP